MILPLIANAIGEADSRRIALVIGNGKYAASPLNNPVLDAQAMSAALRNIGFEVVEYENATRADMLEGLAAVSAKLSDRRSVAMLYYAGHGVQVEWRNYLIPVDAPLESVAQAIEHSLPLDTFLASFIKSKTATNIVVLDACRSNPLQGKDGSVGLAGLDAPTDTFLAYATAPGNDADDGSNGHGLYTAALLEEITRPNARIEDVFKRVRLRVRLASSGRQIPWENSSLESDFYFFRDEHAGGEAPKADEKQFEVELAAWKLAESENTPSSWANYLSRFPSGFFTRAAQFRLDHIAEPLAVAQPSPYAEKSIIRGLLPAGAARFQIGDRFVWRFTDDYTQLSKDSRSRVLKIEDEKVYFGGGFVTDQLGNAFSDQYAMYEPIQCFVPPEFVLGHKWSTAFRTTPRYSLSNHQELGVYYAKWDLVVGARESVTVPAGTFDCFRIDGAGFSPNSNIVMSVWYETKTSLKVKVTVRVHTQPHPPGAGNDRFTRELVSSPERLFGAATPGT